VTQAADLVIDGQNVFATGSFGWSDGSTGTYVGVAFTPVLLSRTEALNHTADVTEAMDRPADAGTMTTRGKVEPFGAAGSDVPSALSELAFDASLDFASLPGNDPAAHAGVAPSVLAKTKMDDPDFQALDWATVPLDAESAVVDVGLDVGLDVEGHANFARLGVFDYGVAA
jgi:hypothetical protein